MSRRALRKPAAVAIALTAATATVIGASFASASHMGAGNVLTTSDGSHTITVSGGVNIVSPETVIDAQWSPDGSRAVFVNADGAIGTLRYNDGANVWWVADPLPGVTRKHPTWRADGSFVAWSEQQGAGQPWRIALTSSSYGYEVAPISPNDGFDYTHPDAGGFGRQIVFQRQADASGTPTGPSEVWIFDLDEPTPTRLVAADASSPALSPDGTQVAFVRSIDGHAQIFTSDLAGANVTQVTTDAAEHDNPAWSPSGEVLSFNVGGGVAQAPAGGGATTTVDGLTGVPAYQAATADMVLRLAGANRFATSTAVSESLWATAGDPVDQRDHASAVVLSRSDTFADALSGSALAAAKGGPLLMTPPASLNSTTKAEISRVLGTDPAATVYLLGSTGALSLAVENEIKAMGYTTVRLAGTNRFATSIAIAEAITPNPDLVLAATGMDFPDALAAGAAAGSFDTPGSSVTAVVVLTANTTLPAETKKYLDDATTNPDTVVFGIGGQASTAVAPYNPTEIVGINRYETALLTAWSFFGGEFVAGVATGSNWPDALSGGALLASLNGPLLLTPSTSATLNGDTRFFLDTESGTITVGVIFGGTGAVPAAIDGQVGSWISGPTGYIVAGSPAKLKLTRPAAKNLRAATAGSIAHRSVADIKKAAQKLAKHKAQRSN